MSTTYEATVLADAPLVYYRLNDTGVDDGTPAADSSGNTRTGTFGGSPYEGADSLVPSAPTDLAVDFYQSYIATSALPWLNVANISAEAWAWSYQHGFGPSEMILLDRENGADRCFRLGTDVNDHPFFEVTTSAGVFRATGTSTLVAEVAAHYVGTYDGTAVRIYLNGQLDGSTTANGTLDQGSPELHVAASVRTGDYAEFWDGVIDEAAVYGSALTATRVAAHYDAAMGGSTPAPQTVPVGLAASTQTAGAMTARVEARRTIGQVVETGAPQQIAVRSASLLTVARIIETQTAQPIAVRAQRLMPGDTSTAVGTVPSGGFPTITEGVQLVILDPDQVRSPCSLQVTVSGTGSEEQVDFHIDDVYVYSAVSDVNGYLDVTSVPIPDEDPIGLKGTHTLKVTSPEGGQDTATFTLQRDMPRRLTVLAPDVDPVVVPASDGRWVLQDVLPGGLGSWVMPVNPQSMTSPHLEKAVTVGHTAAPRGAYQLSEGNLGTKDWTLQGYYPDQDYVDRLKAYAAINRRIYVIDHRGRAWKVAVAALTIEPRRRQADAVSENNDWAGSWELNLVIHDQRPVNPT